MSAKPANKPAPLGRGLSALFGDSDAAYQPRAATGNAVRAMPIDWIQPGAFQPRRHFDDESIAELAASIKQRGVLQPLIVRAIEGERDSYEIIAGERRWRAAQVAGIHEVPVLVRTFSDREAMEIGLIENVQRLDLSPLEEAEGYRRLMDEFSYTQDGLAKVVGKSRPHISNILRLLSLPDSVKQMILSGELSMGHARAVITSKDPEALAREIVKKGMTVRQAEDLARRETEGKTGKRTPARRPDPDVIEIEKMLERKIGLRVRLNAQGTRGSLTFFYSDLDQLDGLIKRLQE